MPSETKDAEQSSTSISIVIVTYNNIRWIKACLKGLASSAAGFNSQLFIIDNSSTDGTVVFLRNKNLLQSQFNRVKVILNSENVGFTRAVNQGLRLCTGNRILLLNPDVVLSEKTLSVLLQCLEKNPQIGVVAPQLRYPDGRIQPSCRRFPQKMDVIFDIIGVGSLRIPLVNKYSWKMPDFDHASSRDVEQPQGAFLLFPRDVLLEVGLLDEDFPMFFSDVDWCRRVRQQGWRIRFCAETFAYHAKGDSVYYKRLKMVVSSHRSFFKYFLKYAKGYKLADYLIGLLLLLLLIPRLVAIKLMLQH
ncbi:glycosyltransferase family 2 protein [candidate division KSB1 bacterium]|nr:glycosyltransferase family 2 protein [candidate division KSB1 bacterium]